MGVYLHDLVLGKDLAPKEQMPERKDWSTSKDSQFSRNIWTKLTTDDMWGKISAAIKTDCIRNPCKSVGKSREIQWKNRQSVFTKMGKPAD